MSKNVIPAVISVCIDCAVVLANGCDDCTHGPHDDCHTINMSDSDITLGAGSDDCRQCGDPDTHGDCEAWFSWSQCECCGTRDGGDRMHATRWDPAEGEPAAVVHAGYPHTPGTLYDCEACEAACHCSPGGSQCVFSGEHSGEATDDMDAACPDRVVRIPRHTEHLGSEAAWREVAACEGVREISDACAVTVAGWWQSPRGPGEAFTRLVSHFPVEVSELCAAVSYELAQLPAGAQADRNALGMLATWAINRWRGESVAA